MSPEQSHTFGPRPPNWYGSPTCARAKEIAVATAPAFGAGTEGGFGAGGWLGDGLGDGGGMLGLGPVSYTHLTLPTTPYV